MGSGDGALDGWSRMVITGVIYTEAGRVRGSQLEEGISGRRFSLCKGPVVQKLDIFKDLSDNVSGAE